MDYVMPASTFNYFLAEMDEQANALDITSDPEYTPEIIIKSMAIGFNLAYAWRKQELVT